MSNPTRSRGRPANEPTLSRRQTVLLVDDDPGMIALEQTALSPFAESLHMIAATDGEKAIGICRERRPDLVLLDLFLPGVEGFALLERLLEIRPEADIILITAHYSPESAVEAIQKGAYDYLTKPLPVDKLQQKVAQWLERAIRRDEASRLQTLLAETCEIEGIVGQSPVILEMFSRIRRIAPHFTTAMIVGETGTGKELAARALHRLSPAAEGPFVVCNCAAISEHLFESELFGHARGSFTGAVSDHTGYIERAAQGTLFLDEIGEIPVQVQAKLLRFLQSREIQRIGDPRMRTVDVRIIAATNRDLPRMIADHTFRDDLYYRLAMVTVRTPRLSERREDIPLLVQHFLRRMGEHVGWPSLSLSRRATSLVLHYPWPGNVRELENALLYCAMMARHHVIEPEDFPETIREQSQSSSPIEFGDLVTLEEMERRYMNYVLARVGGNRVKAAAVLGIGRATLYRMLDRDSDTAAAGSDTE
jgi:two-component system response regulator HydG